MHQSAWTAAGEAAVRVVHSQKVNMKQMYEVLKFIEYGNSCRQSLDCIAGTLLPDFLREHPVIEKQLLFRWLFQIGTGMEQYQKCRSGKTYPYLNPYSIVVSEEEKLFLLDPDAPENRFVMKKLQKRAVKAHFVKSPVCGKVRSDELYGFGRLIQFLAAYMDIVPPLTVREKMKLSRVAEKCTAEKGKKYAGIRQMLGDMPSVPKRKTGRKRADIRKIGIAVIAVALCTGGVLYVYEDGDRLRVEQHEEEQTSVQLETMVERALWDYLLRNTKEDNEKVIFLGRKTEREILYAMAEALERENRTGQAILVLERLIEIEEREERLLDAGIRKMKLEAEQGLYGQAVRTGEDIMEKTERSKEIEELTEQYRTQAAKENQENNP